MNVMLVDDYPLLLRGIVKTYPWAENGFPIVAQAENGRQALCLLEKQPVDILITDIRMPVMDGLELIREVRARYPAILIAVLSAYDDFAQVRTAFQLGANDYLLKQELNAEVIHTVLERLEAAARIERGRRELPAALGDLGKLREEKEREEEASDRQALYLRSLLKDGARFDPAHAAREGVTFPAPQIALMQLVLESFDVEENAELALFSVEQKLKRAALEQDCYLFRTSYNEFNFLYGLPDGDASAVAVRIFSAVQNALSGSGVVLTASVSGTGRSLADLRALYTQARQTSGARFGGGRGKLLFFEELPADGAVLDPEIRSRVAILRNSLKNKDYDGLLSRLDQLTVSESGSRLTRRQIELLFTRYALTAITSVEEQNLPIDCDKLLITLQFLLSGDSLRELNDWLRETLTRMLSLSESKNQYIRLFGAYIERHFAESELRVEDAAGALGISVGYMGKLLYRETGCHFAEYLNQYRVERAKEFLAASTLRVYEVADKTGYNNVEHFTRVFKKLVGVSPTAYANRG